MSSATTSRPFADGAPTRLLGDAAYGVLAANGILDRAAAQDLVQQALGFATAEATRVNVNSSVETNVRFADNQMSTAGSTTNTTVRIQSAFGRRRASVVTNDLSADGLRRAVQQAEAIAKLSPEDPEYLGELGPQQYATIPAWFDSTANVTAEARARAALTALEPARKAGDLTVAGFIVCTASANAVGTSRGLFGYHRATNANYTLTARTNDGTGSGWAGADANDWAAMDFGAVAERAIGKARASRNPVAIEPGRYTVIFEPEAVDNLVGLMRGALQARSADEGRSAFSSPGGTKVGQKIVDERVTLASEPSHPLVLGAPFDDEGLPTGANTWIEGGVLRQLAYDRFWADKQGKPVTGGTGSLRMAGGPDTRESLIASTRRGLLVTRLWYIRSVDQQTLVNTGLTRDGTFLIENGEIVRPVKNFRFNDSPLFMLNNLDGIASAERSPSGGMVVPTVRVRDFNFTSLSDAV